MATKYIVHSVSRATAKNVNFKGDVVESYNGKRNALCGLYHNHGEECIREKPFIPSYDAREYGYDRISDAKRNWSFKNREDSDYWETFVEIIAVEI